jgi:phosphatidylglycerophosphate synthase
MPIHLVRGLMQFLRGSGSPEHSVPARVAPSLPGAAYRSDDRELTVGLYRRLYWNRLTPLLPDALSPNLITVVGQLSVILAAVCAAGAVRGTPSLYLASAFLLHVYLTCDNIDGPHARRTGQSSPLGEFLDHGLDALASGALLITGLYVAHVDGLTAASILGIGAVGYISCMWEQYRTGVLVIPTMSASEGVTLISILEVTAFVLGDPTWLAYRPGEMSLATGLVLFALACYAFAILPPLVRCRRAGIGLGEVAVPMLIALSTILYAVAGANVQLVGVLATLFAADISCRLILLRHGHLRGDILLLHHYLLILPLVPALLLPDVWTANGWASLALGLAAVSFVRSLARGVLAFSAEAGPLEA